ncbi:MAG: helix-turn-helix domain-containing protein [Bacteroidales bacterium]|jgi:transcriptional regulator with XRE-family HTH domain|nr:helix-turn-helix domain-containing protein [Bacteroidales bacterium]
MNHDIADRLQIILSQKSLTASQFADEIDVQRSNISHILSRRSKPSLDFIEKMCARFPDIDISWFISGKATHVVSRTATTDETHKKPVQTDLFGNIVEEPKNTNVQQVQTELPPIIAQEQHIIEKSVAEKKVVKIITFYNDNSFQEFVSVD